MKIRRYLFGLGIVLAGFFVACNNEAQDCDSEQFPPLVCELSQLSGKKIDSVMIYIPLDDSVLYKGARLPQQVRIPLSIVADTTFVLFTIVGRTNTTIEREQSILAIGAIPELHIFNVECGPVYCFKELGYKLYSVVGDEPIYRYDTILVETVDTSYINVEKHFVGMKSVEYSMAIDSVHYYSSEIDQDNENHAKIFF